MTTKTEKPWVMAQVTQGSVKSVPFQGWTDGEVGRVV